MSYGENQEENPAEPVPDVATVAEPPQPPEPTSDDEARRSLFPIFWSNSQSFSPSSSRMLNEILKILIF